MLSRRKFIKLAAPALILPSRKIHAAFNSVQTTSIPKNRYPVALDSTKTYFKDQFGDPCLAVGGNPQVAVEMLSAAQIEQYFSTRSPMGYNIGWMISVDNADQTSPEANLAGNLPFGSAASFTNFQTPYWNFVDYYMQRALYWGQTVLFMPEFVGLSTAPTGGYNSAFWNLPTATIQAYAAFLVNRYGSFPNLIWTLGGDADPNVAASYAALNTLATAIKALDATHLMTLEASRFFNGPGGAVPNGGYSSVDACTIAFGSIPSWLDFNWVYQTGPTILSGSQRCYPQGIPCFLGEGWYELDHSQTVANVRAQGYFAITGGCVLGYNFGNGAVWSFNSVNGDTCCTSGTPTWQSQLTSPGSIAQQLMGNLFRSREFYKLVPDITNVVMTSNTGGASTASACRTSDGQSILAYYSTNQSATFDMSKITDAGSQAVAHWFDPTNRAVRNAGTFANSGSQTFSTPGLNGNGDSDWILGIDSLAANLRPLGT